MRIAIVADRIGWEERRLMDAAASRSISTFWLDDADLCLGSPAAELPDADVFMMRGRSYSRSGAQAAMLTDAGHLVVNPPAAIAICQDKLATARVLTAAGLPVPDFRLVVSRRDLAAAVRELGLPCIIKPLFGGLGRRVLIIRDSDLADAVYDFVEHFGQSFDRLLLAQRYHPGHDERVFVVGSQAVVAYRRIVQNDWRANVALGGIVEASDADSSIARLAVSAALAVGADVCAVDLLVSADGVPVVSEVNHVPMFRGAVTATGVDVGNAVIDHLSEHLNAGLTADAERSVPT
jgi:RimK family alpha-L-glutamate ligase